MGGVGGNCGASAKSCTRNGDCVLTPASCCVCGDPELGDYVAINGAHHNACVCQGPACGCAVRPNPYLRATCKSGTCAGFDVQQLDALSACSSDADCTLHKGDSSSCPNCAPVFPVNTHVACVQGRCQVVTQ